MQALVIERAQGEPLLSPSVCMSSRDIRYNWAQIIVKLPLLIDAEDWTTQWTYGLLTCAFGLGSVSWLLSPIFSRTFLHPTQKLKVSVGTPKNWTISCTSIAEALGQLKWLVLSWWQSPDQIVDIRYPVEFPCLMGFWTKVPTTKAGHSSGIKIWEWDKLCQTTKQSSSKLFWETGRELRKTQEKEVGSCSHCML